MEITTRPTPEVVHVYDSAANAFPAWADFLLVYVDGRYANSVWAAEHFPLAHKIPIAVMGQPGVRVCDCENGDLTPAGAAEWAADEVHAARKPWVYVADSNRPAVESGLAARGISPGRVQWWEANPDGIAVIRAGYSAKQYSWPVTHPLAPGQRYDVSVAYLAAVMEADQ